MFLVCLFGEPFIFVSWLFSQAMTGDPSLLLIKVLKCGKEEENKKCSNTNIKKNTKKREKRETEVDSVYYDLHAIYFIIFFNS
jgi:hypothetical protein